jgi:hypothetical protein
MRSQATQTTSQEIGHVLTPDPRHITAGWEIPSEGYCDQPYIVKTDDGAWLCIMTTGSAHEGESGQHVVSTRSTDQGRTWSPLVDVEPADGPEASYAVALKTPGGRVYAFYNHNTDNVRQTPAEVCNWMPDGVNRRVDSLGHFVFKFSDDHGRTWSAQRYDIPMRRFAIDRENDFGGELLYFWNVGKPFVLNGAAYVSVHKVGGFGEGFFTRSEGALLRSANLLTETDPDKIVWETLPDGEVGLRTPAGGGSIAEEQSYTVLSDGSIYCVYRSIDGHPVYSYSRDGGRTWDPPRYKRYVDGRLMKHPRAANFCWRCENGNYLYWFHNHGGTWYEDRNPVWLCGGVEVDSPDGKIIRWSQPEIVLYDDDPYIRMSYPDLVEEDGCYFLTETQKAVARVHPLGEELLVGLWSQFEPPQMSDDGYVVDMRTPVPATAAPALPEFTSRDDDFLSGYGTHQQRRGFTLELWLSLTDPTSGQIFLDTRTKAGQGLCVHAVENGAVEIVLNDGRTENRWANDPGQLVAGQRHHLAIIVDAGPRIIYFVVDGRFNDGGEFRQFGWGRFSPHLRHLNGGEQMCIGAGIERLRVYDRAIRISEAVNNFRSDSLMLTQTDRMCD